MFQRLSFLALLGLLLVAGTAGAAAPGQLDQGFGSAGRVATAFSEYGDDQAKAVAVEGAETIVVGRSGPYFAVAKYTAGGALDTNFGGGDGIATANFGGELQAWPNGVAVDPDTGSIVVVGLVMLPFDIGGLSPGDWAIARFTESGTLDTSFSGDGKLTEHFGDSSEAHDVAIQTDGKLVVAGMANGTMGVARFNTNGTLDSSFSSDGVATADLGPGLTGDGYGSGVAIDGDGNIVVGGTASDQHWDDSFAVARFTPTGAPDATFGTNGSVVTDTGADEQGTDVAIDGNGNILLGGSRLTNDVGDFAVARYTPEGVLDTTFGGGKGYVTADVSGNDIAHQIAVTEGDKILLAGTAGGTNAGEFALAQFSSGGALDSGFGGGDGIVTTDFGTTTSDEVYGLAVGGDNNPVAVGGSSQNGPWGGATGDWVLARYTAAGALDSTFSGDGKAETLIGHQYGDRAYGAAVQSDGRIVVAGSSINEQGADHPEATVARYLPDGSLDTSFADNGRVITDYGNGYGSEGSAVVVQGDGKIVMAGWAWNGSDSDFLVARYTSGGAPDTTFSGDGTVLIDFGGGDRATSVVVQTDGKIVVGGSSGERVALARLTTGGALDSTFSADGRLVENRVGSYWRGLGIQSDGKLVAAGFADAASPEQDQGDFGGVRYDSSGFPDNGFGSGGLATTDFGALDGINNDRASDLAIQSDGRIVVAGIVHRPDAPISDCGATAFPEMDFGVARYLTDGSPDPSFSGDGRATTDIAVDEPYGVMLQPDGKIVVAGRAGTNFALVRYATDGTLDSGFGKVTTDFGGCDVARDIALSNNGLLLVGSTQSGLGSRFALARYVATIPAAPVLTATVPAGPANNNAPLVKGTLGAGSPVSVKLYANAACLGAPAATGSASQFTGGGIAVPVPDNQVTQLSARATDALPTDSDCSNVMAYTEDSTAPETTISDGPSGATTDATPTFSFTASEPGASFECSVDDGPFAACASPASIGPLADGPHSFAVRAIDAVGNADATPSRRDFTVGTPDVTPPVVTLGGKTTQKAGATVSVQVSAPSEALWATVSGTVSVPRAAKVYKLIGVKNRLVARGARVTLKIKVSKKARAAIKRALRSHRKVTATLRISARDAAGNVTVKKRTIRLRR